MRSLYNIINMSFSQMSVSRCSDFNFGLFKYGSFQKYFLIRNVTYFKAFQHNFMLSQRNGLPQLSGTRGGEKCNNPVPRLFIPFRFLCSYPSRHGVSLPVLWTRKLCFPKCLVNLYFLPIKGMAGHSKWQNIRHTKASKDAKKSLLFQKFSYLIRKAVMENGPDPKFNSKLAKIIDSAKGANMPSATIENSIKKAASGKLKTFELEVLGPGGCLLIVVLQTDSLSRAKGDIRSVCRKCQSAVTDSKKSFIYEQKGIIKTNASKEDNSPLDADNALEVAIEAGAEDVQQAIDEEGKPIFKFFCDPDDFFQVKKKLENSPPYVVEEAALEYVPKVTVALQEEEMTLLEKLYERLDENPEVVKVYDNVQ